MKASFLLDRDENETEENAAIPPSGEMSEQQPSDVVYIAPGYIDLDPVTNVRMGEDESDESIAEFAARLDVEGGGQPVPILVRPSQIPGRYKIIAGRRRLRAMTLLGKGILAHVRDVDDQTARRLAFEENYRRKQFSPVELARLFIEARGEKFAPNWSERVSKRFGVSRATVTETIKMHDGLASTPDLLDRVHRGELTGDAAILLAKQAEESGELFQKAQAVAIDEAAKRAAKGKKGGGKAGKDSQATSGPSEGVAGTGQGKNTPQKPVQVKKKHVKAAAKAAGSTKTPLGPLNRAEIVDGLLRLVDHAYPPSMNAFLNYCMTDWQKGNGSQEVLKNHWRAIACLVEETTPGCPDAAVISAAEVVTGLKPLTAYLAEQRVKARSGGHIIDLKGKKRPINKPAVKKPATKKAVVKKSVKSVVKKSVKSATKSAKVASRPPANSPRK